MADIQIRTATWDDEQKIGALMALAFANDPFVRWILPDPHLYIENSRRHAGLAWGTAFDTGSAFIIGQDAGAAFWLPPGTKVERDHEKASSKPEQRSEFPEEFAELIEKSNAYAPREPHWYLACIAVDPASGNRGLGTALLEKTLDICNRDGLPAYLESTNVGNLSLYKRFGFEVLAEVTVGNSPARYPMVRPAKK